MARFVLVHGGTRGGWCWRAVRELLHKAGHDVYTPTLTGLGERAHLAARSINLDTHIEDILGVIAAEELSDFVLCGHSYGGMVITGVADRIPGKISALVYLDAMVPKDGQSAFELLAPEVHGRLLEELGQSQFISPLPAAYFGLDGDDAAWVERRSSPHPRACFEQRISLKGAFSEITKRILVPARSNTVYGRTAMRLRAEDPTWRVEPLEGPHDLMIARAEGVAQLLLATL